MNKNLNKVTSGAKSIITVDTSTLSTTDSDSFLELDVITPTDIFIKSTYNMESDFESDIITESTEKSGEANAGGAAFDYNEIENKYQRFLNAFDKLPTIEELIQREEQRAKKTRLSRVIKICDDGEEEVVEEEEEEVSDDDSLILKSRKYSEHAQKLDIGSDQFDHGEEEFDEDDLYEERASAEEEEESSSLDPGDLDDGEESSTSLQKLIDLDKEFKSSEENVTVKKIEKPIFSIKAEKSKPKSSKGQRRSESSDRRLTSFASIASQKKMEAFILNKIRQKRETREISRDVGSFLDRIINDVVNTMLENYESNRLRLKLDKRKLVTALLEVFNTMNNILMENSKLTTLCTEVLFNPKQLSLFKPESPVKEMASKNRLKANLKRLDSLLKQKVEMQDFYNNAIHKSRETYLNIKQLYKNSVNKFDSLMLNLCVNKCIKREYIETQLHQMKKSRADICQVFHRLVLKMDKYASLNEVNVIIER